MGNFDLKKQILSFYGVKDTDFNDTSHLTGEEKVPVVQDNINVLTTVNDLLNLTSYGFLSAPRYVTRIEEVKKWFASLSPAQGKKVNTVISYYDVESSMYEVIRFIGQNTTKETIDKDSSWEWFTTGSSSFKGLFNDVSELTAAVKNPKVGDHAFVGSPLANAVLYKCNHAGIWTKAEHLFGELLSMTDAIYAEEKGESLEFYDEFIAHKALADAEGNTIHETYVRTSDLPKVKEMLEDTFKNLKEKYSFELNAGYKNFFPLNREDLQYGRFNTIEFGNRLDNTNSIYGYKILRSDNLGRYIIDDKTFEKDGTRLIYAIRYNYNLQGRTIEVPDNTVLDLTHGGSLYNGTLKFGKNVIVRAFDSNQIKTKTEGTFKILESAVNTEGKAGKSAYELAVENNQPNTGSVTEWLNSLKGPKGDPAKLTISDNDTWVINDVDTGKKTKGIDGNPGNDGITPKLRVQNNVLQVSYNNGVNWEDLFTFPTNGGSTPPPQPPTPPAPTVTRPDVTSFSKTSLVEVSEAEIKSRNYFGNLYVGDVLSDGTFKYKQDIMPTHTNKTIFGNQDAISKNPRFSDSKSSEYRYAYSVTDHVWELILASSKTIRFTYREIKGRNASEDWVASPTVTTADVYSLSNTAYRQADNNTLRVNSHTGDIYFGDVLSDNTFRVKATIPAVQESPKLMFGNSDSYSDTTEFGSKGSTYKYAYLVTYISWTRGTNKFSYILRANRNQAEDWREPSLPPAVKTPNVFSFSNTSYDEVTNSKLEAKNHTDPIYFGNEMSDGTFDSKETIPHTQAGSVAYGDQDNANKNPRFGEKGAVFPYAYNIITHSWTKRGVKEFSYTSIFSREVSKDWKDAPKIVRPNVFSFNKTIFEEVTKDELKARKYKGKLYQGNVMSNDTFSTQKEFDCQVTAKVVYGNQDALTKNPTFGAKGPDFKYAYNATEYVWRDLANVYYNYATIDTRQSDQDWVDTGVETPTSEIFLSNDDSLEKASMSSLNSRLHFVRARKLVNDAFSEVTLRSIDLLWNGLHEMPVEGKMRTFLSAADGYNKPVTVYRKYVKGSEEYVKKVAIIDPVHDSLDTSIHTIEFVSELKGIVFRSSVVPELNNIVAYYGENDDRSIKVVGNADILVYKVRQLGGDIDLSLDTQDYTINDTASVLVVLHPKRKNTNIDLFDIDSGAKIPTDKYTVNFHDTIGISVFFPEPSNIPTNGFTVRYRV